ncbi:hypothetical protein L227DRAFT_421061 [Lentinus tigrinus ALCF2SS1-6]|uniref:F-box domain-containing protein n=1 Tax=Lentinus tigrinus ALCF2SS1-6 TaxID=1328759 RepID=A0A5C2RRC7_9APHY|nr:hypothetical protein L227DRAFT_421061 [Lentinus tigrinus ALCF2SS1-6]
MTTPIIPLELQELIIDSVQDRDHALFTETLKSCCLTCRAWLPRSIRRLYHRLIVGNLRPAQFDKLVRLIDTSPYVADAIEELVVGVVFQGTEDVVGGVAIRAVLAGKLPRLRSLTLIGSGSLVQSAPPPLVVSSPPCRLPTLAGFPTLTTLHLSFVFFTSYVSFQRMFSSVPGLRRLHASYVICNHTRIPPAFPSYPPLKPPLTHVVWYENATSEGYALPHLLRNVCGSLEDLTLSFPDTAQSCIDQAVSLINTHPYFQPFSLPRLGTLRVCQALSPGSEMDALRDLVRSHVRLLATLLRSPRMPHPHMARRSQVHFKLKSRDRYTAGAEQAKAKASLHPGIGARGTGMSEPVQDSDLFTGRDTLLGKLLHAIKAHSTEMDSALLAGRACAWRVVFEFTLARAGGRSATTQDDDPRVIVASLSAAMAALFPTLHRDGLLLVTFQCPDGE